jgi:hypothetical protein
MTVVGKGFRGTAILLAVGSSVTLAGVGLGGASASVSAEVEKHLRAAGGPSTIGIDSASNGGPRTGPLVDAALRAVAAGIPGAVVRVDRGRGGMTDLADQAEWTKVEHRLSLEISSGLAPTRRR